MELPEMSFKDWESQQESRCVRESRATVASVANYYSDYVKSHNLKKYFRDFSVITEVNSGKSLPNNCDNLPVELLTGEEEDRNFRRHTISEIPVGKVIKKRFLIIILLFDLFQRFVIKSNFLCPGLKIYGLSKGFR
jgi:hypothetical protein